MSDLSNLGITEIYFGKTFGVGLSSSGEVYLWGVSELFKDIKQLPRPVILEGTQVTSVRAGAKHILLLTSKGKVLAFGSGEKGQLGLGTKENRDVPWLIGDLYNHRVVKIACGEYHSLALTENEELFTWGDNSKFSCGHSFDKKEIALPQAVADIPPNRQVIQLFTGRKTSGILVCKPSALSLVSFVLSLSCLLRPFPPLFFFSFSLIFIYVDIP